MSAPVIQPKRIPPTPYELMVLKQIKAEVLKFYEMTEEEFEKTRHKKKLWYVKQTMMYIAHDVFFISPTKTAVFLGYLQHGTVLHAAKTVNDQASIDKAFAKSLRYICSVLLELKQPPLAKQLKCSFEE